MAEVLNKAGRNERRKLTATAVNTIALSFIVTGIVVPVVSLTQVTGNAPAGCPMGFVPVWLAVGAGLHVVARKMPVGLEE